MNLDEFEASTVESQKKLKESIEKLISDNLKNLDEVKWMKEKVPLFENIYIAHDWSGFNDGDAEYPIIRAAYGEDLSHPDSTFGYYEYQFCNTGEGEYISWDERPSDEEYEQLKTLNEDDFDKFVSHYNSITNILERFIEENTGVGTILTFSVVE